MSKKVIIENGINLLLEGDNKKIALEFVSYLRENKPSPVWVGESMWKVIYRKTMICYIGLPRTLPIHNPGEGSWLIRLQTSDNLNRTLERLISAGMPKDVIWDNIRYCTGCCGLCNPNQKKTILGKTFENVCGSWLAMKNPDNTTIEWVKKFIEVKKESIANPT